MSTKITLVAFTLTWLAFALIAHFADPGNIFSLISFVNAVVYNAAYHVVIYKEGTNA